MNFISVKKAAKKFNISERRVQKLCEEQRIEGCIMISGVWLIPDGAKKPSDDRISCLPENSDVLNLSSLCNLLSISLATGRNWIKLGKLKPNFTEKGIPYFEKDYASKLQKDILSGTNSALKSRRNKKFVSGNSLYNSYVSEKCVNLNYVQNLISILKDAKILLTDEIIQYIVADCSIKLLLKKKGQAVSNPSLAFVDFLTNKIELNEQTLVEDFIDNKNSALSFAKNNPDFFRNDYVYEKNEDVMGLIYISSKSMGNRKATGTYYTPTRVVKKLVDSLSLKNSSVVLDPCCGTGNFLLQIPENIPFENIYGNDIDSVSIKIARINMALKFPDVSVDVIRNHITEKNFLVDFKELEFTHIIGNPPWGYVFTEDEKKLLRKKFRSAVTTNIESYDVFIEQSLSLLKKNGLLSFVLPEALLNVKAHTDVRNIILNQTSIKKICYLGNAFDKVQCPCIILQLKNTRKKLSTKGMFIDSGDDSFLINSERCVMADYFSFLTNDSEYSIIQKVKNKENCTFLFGKADFALGIVTGSNKDYISNKKSSENEIVLKGSDIRKYRVCPSDNYIVFEPENFQQVAPVQMYRAKEKLLYRFISNQLTFAYDNKQTLSLNSCNILIPKIKNLNIKYIMAVLNSRIAQFIFKKEYNSIKILRAHIENIPIPVISEDQQNYIVGLTDNLSNETDSEKILALYEKIDSEISALFDLSDEEVCVVKNAVDGDNKFLL